MRFKFNLFLFFFPDEFSCPANPDDNGDVMTFGQQGSSGQEPCPWRHYARLEVDSTIIPGNCWQLTNCFEEKSLETDCEEKWLQVMRCFEEN